MSFSNDGTTLATCAQKGGAIEIQVWNTSNGKQERSLTWQSPNNRLAICRDHKLAAIWPTNIDVLEPAPLELWDLATGAQRAVLKHPTYVDDAEFLADGKTLMTFCSPAGGPSELKLWDLQTGAERPLSPRCWHGRYWHSRYQVLVAPDGSIFANGEKSGVRIWDVATGKEQAFLKEARDGLLFSPDAKSLLCSGVGREIELWNFANEHVFVSKTWDPPFSFSPDGNLLVLQNTAADSLTVLDKRTGKPSRTISWKNLPRLKIPGGPEIKGLDTQFTSDGKTVVSVNVAGDTRIWDVASGADVGSLPTLRYSGIKAIVAGTRGILTNRPSWPGICPVGEDTRKNEEDVELWDLASRSNRAHWRIDCRLVALSANKEWLACGYKSGAVKLWNLRRLLEMKPDK